MNTLDWTIRFGESTQVNMTEQSVVSAAAQSFDVFD